MSGPGQIEGFDPDVVLPGQIAIGYLLFDSGAATKQSKFTIDVSSDPGATSDSGGAVDLRVGRFNRTTESILGTVTNDTSEKVSGPIGVSILCFTTKGAILDFCRGWRVCGEGRPRTRSHSSFCAYLAGQQCPTYLIGSSGYSF